VHLDSGHMEWLLQVVDEFDDAVGALRHGWLGFSAEIGVLLFAGIGIGAVIGALALGADPVLVGAAAIMANLAALLKIRSSRAALGA
jgi:hypothetical protein